MSDASIPKTSALPGFYADFADFASLRSKSTQDPDAALSEVAEQFEALLLAEMLKAMRDTLPKDGLFGSSEVSTYQNMLDQQLARNLSSSGSIGLADLIERQLRPPVPPVAPEAMPGAVDGGASSEAEQ